MTPPNPDDRPFRHYTAKHRIVAWISQNLFDNITYTVRHGLIRGMKRRGGLAWMPESLAGATATAEQSFWMSRDFRDFVVYDIGAFHGLLTLFFARTARAVVSYEPNSRNHARLLENLGLNGMKNVCVRKVGIGSKAQSATMVALPLMPGGASVERATVAGIVDSRSRVFSEEIRVVSLDEDIRETGLPAPDFIKIDIEGGELEALIGARNTLALHRPALFLEMHGETMNLKRRNVAAIVACLHEFGYRDIRHVETGAAIDAANSALAAEGHLYCMHGCDADTAGLDAL